MRAIMVMFDSLNRRYLPCYGNDWVHAPSFDRLAQRTVVFDRAYVGSMPCMPARRELHTGRYNFLHRSWGPIEPFDDSMPQILKEHGIHTHLVSDHQHYWEDGGCTYHQRYTTWNNVRGQEGDKWKPVVGAVDPANTNLRPQDAVNRQFLTTEEAQPQTNTFAEGIEFLELNHKADNWFLHIETFDPHEPFFTQDHYKALYPDDYDGPEFDWPEYRPVDETDEEIEHVRNNYAALLSMCDANLAKVIDFMDAHDMWRDTMLIVNTDHGFLLGEHDWWAKCRMPFYNEIANMPLFVWDPRVGAKAEHRKALVQTIDLAPTVLEYFGVDRPDDMQGIPLRETVAEDKPIRAAGLYGLFGAQVNVTDGRYVYMRGPVGDHNTPLNEYTLMPTHMRTMFSVDELQEIEIAEPFPFTKNVPLMKIEAKQPNNTDIMATNLTTMLFDLFTDPGQLTPVDNPEVEAMMVQYLIDLMVANDAPAEQYERLGLERPTQ